MFVVGSNDDDEDHFFIFKLKLKESRLVNSKQYLWMETTDDQFGQADELNGLWYNSNLTQIVLADSDSIGIITFKGDAFQHSSKIT